MSKKVQKPDTKEVKGIDLSTEKDRCVMVVRAIRPLTEDEHEMVKRKLETEQAASGVSIVLLPNAVEFVDFAAVASTAEPEGTPAANDGKEETKEGE